MTYRFLALSALTLSLCSQAALAAGAATDDIRQKPVRVILVGDSTMAPRSGYGDALCQRFTGQVTCLNLAKGGRSSASYRAEGLWEQVRGLLQNKAYYSVTYVLIQFGHNDQPGKPGRSTDLATEFPVNMARYVQETLASGAVPVLVTPLTRRNFRDGVLQNDLRAWAEASRLVAANQSTAVLDLNAESAAAVQAMGEAEADSLAMAPPPDKAAERPANETAKGEPAGNPKSAFDRTHLGSKGAQFFARMVAHELSQALPAITNYLAPEKAQ